MKKVCILGRQDPWVMWHRNLQAENVKGLYFKEVSSQEEADIVLFDSECEESKHIQTSIDKPCFMFMNKKIKMCQLNPYMKFIVTTNSLREYLKTTYNIEEERIIKWIPPVTNFEFDRHKMVDFVCVINAEEQSENVAELIKSFLAFSIDGVDDDHIIEGKNSLRIFSAQELKITPFNNIIFMGLQSNRVMYKALLNSSCLICPYSGIGRPHIVDVAIENRVPVLIKDTPENRETFDNLSDWFFYDKENLEKKLDQIYNMNETVYDMLIATYSASLVTPVDPYKEFFYRIGVL